MLVKKCKNTFYKKSINKTTNPLQTSWRPIHLGAGYYFFERLMK